MKKNKFLIMLFILVTFVGCNSTVEHGREFNENLDAYVRDYQEKNMLDVICGAIDYDEEVIVFENVDEYGIASFYVDDKTSEIKYEISIIEKSNDLERVEYTQVKGKSEYFIGIFITDEKLVLETDGIKVVYADELKNKPYSTQVTLNDTSAQIISYDSEQIRKIRTVQLLNTNGQEVYELN